MAGLVLDSRIFDRAFAVSFAELYETAADVLVLAQFLDQQLIEIFHPLDDFAQLLVGSGCL